MKPPSCSGYRSLCPINVSLEIFGDRWSLLIVRDLMFYGRTAFHDFMNGGEKIATNILTDRLKALVANGIIEKRRDPADARRINYALTEKGIDLAPVLIEMVLWATSHEETAAPKEVVEDMRQNRASFLADLRRRWEGERKR